MLGKKVCFVIPSSAAKAYQDLAKTYSAVEMPTWAALLAQAIRRDLHDPVILDFEACPSSDEQAAELIAETRPYLVVFVLYGQNPNSGTTMMIGASSLAKQLKLSHPNLKIAFIGSHSSALPFEVIQYKYVDFAFINEGIYALLGLLKTNLVDGLDKVAGIWYKSNGLPTPSSPGRVVNTFDMDNVMPGYAWDLLPKNNKLLDKYRAHFWHSNFSHEDRTPFAAIYTSLGCSFGCSFCMINVVNRTSQHKDIVSSDSKGMRFWSPDLILKQLEMLWSAGVRTIRITDEMFFLNKKYYVPILQGLVDRKIKFNLWAYARIDSVRKDQLQLFKEAGVNWLCLGIEAGNQNVRIEIDKGKFQQIDIRQVVTDVKDAGINILGNYMFGFPEDSYETMQETFDLAKELNCEHANFYAAMALPGSPLHLYARKNNWEIPEKFEEYAFLSYECKPLRTKYLSGAEVLRFRDEKWSEYFTNAGYLNLVEAKFGKQSRANLEEMAKIKLKRKLLGD
jgi:anaerobic magnesium-protoporphyrin IX monomethyl ester cyclase